jgi:uncharacterized membrane protein
MSDIATAETFRLANVFSKSAAIYGRHFVPFVILTVIASIPNYIVVLVVGQPTPGNVDSKQFATIMGVSLLATVTRSLAAGAVIYGVIQELRGRSFSIGHSLQIALRRILPIIGITICVMLAIMLGSLLLIVPGLILACMFYVAVPACVAEQTGVFTSMSRSRALTKGHRWQVFGTFLLLLVIALVLFGIEVAAAGVAGKTVGLIFQQTMGAIFGAFMGVLSSVFYYELRVAKEGVDIDKIAGVFD